MNDIYAALPSLMAGFWLSFLLSCFSLVIGLGIAFAITISKFLGGNTLKLVLKCLVTFICGTPLLVQIFLLYYGVAQFDWLRQSPLWTVLQDPSVCATLALAINTGCYTAVLLEGAVAAIPRQQTAAAEALGMSRWLTLKRVILPQAMRIFLPAYSNEMIVIVKNTSLASTITLLDIMGVTQLLIAESFDTVKWYVVAGVLYLILNGFFMMIYFLLNKYLSVPDQHELNASH